MESFAQTFREKIVPPFLEWVQRSEDLSAKNESELLDLLHRRIQGTLVDFARHSLKATALASWQLSELERKLAEVMDNESASEVARELLVGVRPAEEVDLATAILQLSRGQISQEFFLDRFGHRGGDEMELAQPRWREEPSRLFSGISSGETVTMGPLESRLKRERRLNAEQRALLLNEAAPVRELFGLREAAKHYFMMGYARIREVLVELDRRHQLHGGLFFLTLDELLPLSQGDEVRPLIAQRRRERALLLGLEVPPVLFSDDLEAIGRPIVLDETATLRGVPLSPGIAEGPALVLREPCTPTSEGYILVCPFTDPAWMPLLTGARGLVAEVGGVLSHGAIIARELGLPAIAGVPELFARVSNGRRIRLDGTRGAVTLLD